MDDSILSNIDTTTESILEPYLKTRENKNAKKDDEPRQMKRKCNDANLEANNTPNTLNNERPNKRMCNAERFEAIKYSLGPNEEYIAIRRCEYDTWERNEDTMSQIYQEIFQKKDNGWKDLAAKKSTKLVKYQSSGILCVVVMLEYRRIYNTHPCS
ncbi:hypothetical protein Tco_0525558 [Tanacetum coccineum]